jgi:hypothetical protein
MQKAIRKRYQNKKKWNIHSIKKQQGREFSLPCCFAISI